MLKKVRLALATKDLKTATAAIAECEPLCKDGEPIINEVLDMKMELQLKVAIDSRDSDTIEAAIADAEAASWSKKPQLLEEARSVLGLASFMKRITALGAATTGAKNTSCQPCGKVSKTSTVDKGGQEGGSVFLVVATRVHQNPLSLLLIQEKGDAEQTYAPEDENWPEAWYMVGDVPAGEPQKQENRLQPNKVKIQRHSHCRRIAAAVAVVAPSQ